jgi:hypothetical protein
VLSFATPAWLLGLLLVPVIRWLHRGGPQRRAVPVASLALWRKAETTGPAAGARRPPDPAWRRRALIATLLALVLAGPQTAVEIKQITLWVDDSLSMLTREDGVPRLARGLELAATELASRPGVAVEVRTLSHPWEVHRGLDAGAIGELVAAAGQQEPAPPPAALWRGDCEQWLVTDGASDALDGRGYRRVIQVGDMRRNVGLLRLSARRSLEDRDRLDVEVQARNGGDTAEERAVALSGDGGEILRSKLRLEPGESVTMSASAMVGSRLSARLEPGDALEADDSISLDTSLFAAKPVNVDPSCPASLVTALRAHPALTLTSETAGAALSVVCTNAIAPGPQPLLHIQRGESPQAVDGPLLWSPTVDRSSRKPGDYALRTAGRLAAPQAKDLVLLATGATPLIVRRAGDAAILIETSLDVGINAGDDPAALPLLVAFLVDEALSTSLLDSVAINARASGSVVVVPRAIAEADSGASATASATGSRARSRPLLFLALLALSWELAVLLRRLRRERTEAEAWPQ